MIGGAIVIVGLGVGITERVAAAAPEVVAGSDQPFAGWPAAASGSDPASGV